jgi:hypothetical protein
LNLKALQFLIEFDAFAQDLRGAGHSLARNAQEAILDLETHKNQSLAPLPAFTLKRD